MLVAVVSVAMSPILSFGIAMRIPFSTLVMCEPYDECQFTVHVVTGEVHTLLVPLSPSIIRCRGGLILVVTDLELTVSFAAPLGLTLIFGLLLGLHVVFDVTVNEL